MTHSGLFYEPPVKQVKQKAQPPFPFWKQAGYLPDYNPDPVSYMTDDEIISSVGDTLICDIELYPNYFLAAFMSVKTGKCVTIETDLEKLNWILHNFQIVTFNGNHFDVPIMTLAIAGQSIEELKYAAEMLIVHGVKGWQLLKSQNIRQLQIDHIDLIEVCPLSASLKIYGGRLHVPRMQDLPFDPDAELTSQQIEILKNYCVNDLTTTAYVYMALQEQLGIRNHMTEKYGVDLRSKSDAQIAEAVFRVELKRMGSEASKSDIEPGYYFRYKAPEYLKFRSEELSKMLIEVQRGRFVVKDNGKLHIPEEFKDLNGKSDKEKERGRLVTIGKNSYRMGIGGLHSCEENVAYKSDQKFCLRDWDVSSYYPTLILNQNLFPKHLGVNFMNVYRSIVSRRLKAKREGNKIEADMFKIVANGTFGKLGSRYSIFYSPDLLIQTTLTGQLSLLMLIEMLEEKGIQTCSANTDGIVIRYPKTMEETAKEVFKAWEAVTGFETEETVYEAIYLVNVNNYLAVKPDGKAKLKGSFSIGDGIFRFHKNPTNTICVDAVVAFLTKGTPIRDTIRNCKDFTKFVTVRAVKGGAVKDKTYLGKAVRWYYSTTTPGEIIYASNGNKVPKSENSQPCMQLPEKFPDDVDYYRYELEALEMLKDCNAI